MTLLSPLLKTFVSFSANKLRCISEQHLAPSDWFDILCVVRDTVDTTTTTTTTGTTTTNVYVGGPDGAHLVAV